MSTNSSRFTYGRRDVTTTVGGGSPRSNNVGEDARLILIGDGITDDSTAGDPNTVYDITTPVATREVGTFFGQQSYLSTFVREAIGQTEPPGIVKAMAPATESNQGEDPSANGGSLSQYPILTGSDHPITVTDSNDEQLTHQLVYEHSPDPPSDADAYDVVINPKRGQVVPSESVATPVSVSYDYPDYEGALSDANDSLMDSIPEGRTGLIAVIDAAESIATRLAGTGDSEDPQGVLDHMRAEARGAKGLIAAEPTRTVFDSAGNAYPWVEADPDSTDHEPYTHQMDRRGMYVAGPDALDFGPSSGVTYRQALAGVAGRMAGNSLNSPVFNKDLAGYGRLHQSLRGKHIDYLRSQGVMPLDDRRTGSGGRNLVIAGHTSTKQNPSYDDSFQFQRVIDRWIGDVHRTGKDLLGGLAYEDFQEPAETRLRNRWLDYVNANVMRETVQGPAAGGSGPNQQNTDPTAAGDSEEQEAFFITFELLDGGTVVVGTGIAPTPTITSVHNDVVVSTAAVIGEASAARENSQVAANAITIQN